MPSTHENRIGRAPRAPDNTRCLLHNGTGHVHDAVIKERSETGLRIRFTAPISLPQHIELSCQALGLRAHARVVWQRGGMAGLSLVPGESGCLSRDPTA